MRDHLAGWDLEFTQLAPGPVVGSHAKTRIGSIVVQGGETLVPLIQRGTAPPLATFSVMASPSIRLTSRGRVYGGDRVQVTRPGDEIHWRTGPDFTVRTISVNEGLLRQVARGLDLEQSVDDALRAQTIRPAPDRLTLLRRALFDDQTKGLGPDGEPPSSAASPRIERRLIHLLARALASHEGTVEPDRLRRLDRVMLDVQALLSRHPDRTFSREELSDAVGVSDRSIRRASQAWCGTAPLSLVKIRRLHAARRDFRRADSRNDRVIDVAVRWGFKHMSRFAEEYGALFGERPSETLRVR